MTDEEIQSEASALTKRMGLPEHGPLATAIAALCKRGRESDAVICDRYDHRQASGYRCNSGERLARLIRSGGRRE